MSSAGLGPYPYEQEEEAMPEIVVYEVHCDYMQAVYGPFDSAERAEGVRVMLDQNPLCDGPHEVEAVVNTNADAMEAVEAVEDWHARTWNDYSEAVCRVVHAGETHRTWAAKR